MPPTGIEAEKEVDDLVDIRKYHHDGEDLSEFPCFVNLDDAAPNVRPVWQDVRRVSRYLSHESVKGGIVDTMIVLDTVTHRKLQHDCGVYRGTAVIREYSSR